MPRDSIAYEVLIAFPSDVTSQHHIVAEVVGDWNSAHARARGIVLQSRRWELDAVPQMGERPQALMSASIQPKHVILFDNAGQPERKRRRGFEDFALVDHAARAFQVSGTQRRQAVINFVVRRDGSSLA